MYCQVDPNDPLNADIVNIDKAPVNEDGLVAFDVDFVIIKPVDLTKGNGRILYDTPNRGRMITLGAFGEDLLLEGGYTIVSTGWQASYPLPTMSFFVGLGSRLPGASSFTGRFPVAEKEDGSPVVGWSREEYYDPPLNVPSPDGVFTKYLTYPAADTSDTDSAYLTVRRHERDTNRVAVDWEYLDDYRIQFDEPEGYDSGAIYEFIYKAKDPIIYGLGFAGIRDSVSFLRYEKADDNGNTNPLYVEREHHRWRHKAHEKKKCGDGAIQYALAYGMSQTGRVIKTFVIEGFNEDENGRKVFDGINTHIGASRKNWLNGQFSHPGDIFGADQFPFSYASTYDPLSQLIGGNLDKCEASNTCPKIMHTDTETEIWSSAASLVITDTQGVRDLKLPRNVRTYMFTGARHGAGPGAYGTLPVNARAQQLENPLNYSPLSRALLVALDDWATRGIRPPRSRYPRLKDHTFVPAETLDFPDIPAFTYNEHEFPAVDYNALYMPAYLLDYGAYPDPPQVLGEYPVYVMNVDRDGNGVGRHPTARYTGSHRDLYRMEPL